MAGTTSPERFVHESVEQVERLDPINRKIVWNEKTPLSFEESVQRIGAHYPEIPAELIHSHLVGWLEQGELPDGIPEDHFDEMDSLVTEWADELNGLS